MNKFLFFDIDGTLRSKRNYSIPESAYHLLRALKKKGYHMGIATGRGLYSARMFATELGMDFVISDGGRTVMVDGKIIYTNPIHQEVVDKVSEFAKKYNIPIGYSNHYAIHSQSDIFSQSFELDQTILCSVKKKIDISKLFGVSKLYLWTDKEVFENDPYVSQIEHHWLREKLCVIEHRHKDEGIQVVQNYFNICSEDMVAFGDDINDITMFMHCKEAVCLGNANDQTKSYATYVTDDIDNDGLLKAALAINLIKEEDLL